MQSKSHQHVEWHIDWNNHRLISFCIEYFREHLFVTTSNFNWISRTTFDNPTAWLMTHWYQLIMNVQLLCGPNIRDNIRVQRRLATTAFVEPHTRTTDTKLHTVHNHIPFTWRTWCTFYLIFHQIVFASTSWPWLFAIYNRYWGLSIADVRM